MEEMRKTILVIISIIAIILIGCEKDNNCSSGGGTVATQILTVPDFDGIDLAFSSNVTIKQGVIREVKAIGHPNIISNITTSVFDNLWVINLEDGCYEDYELSIEITVPNINRLFLSGSGNMSVNNFTNQNDNLDIEIIGSGNITLNEFEGIINLDAILEGSGNFKANNNITTETITLDISGSGNYSGFEISSDDSTINSSGSGSSELTAINSLNVSISGSGDIFYKGTPIIIQNITGPGLLINAN
jgi:Putative auto-transporter adhesin, head GIN domain